MTKVLLVGDWPKIEAAYEALGVPVEHISADAAMGAPTAPEVQAEVSRVVPRVTEDERARVYIPEDWRELSWTKATESGLTLRGLGAIFSSVPVLNKGQAVDAVEAELRRRANRLTSSADEA